MEMKLDKNNVEDILALTPMQEGLLFLYLTETAGERYFEQLILQLDGEIDPDSFIRAWRFVADTNEMLRTVFRWEGMEKPVQIILRNHTVPVETYDFSELEETEREKRFKGVKERDRRDRIDIRLAPLRITLVKFGPDRYRLMISNYHILFDGWSYGILLKEFFDAYHQYAAGSAPGSLSKTRFKEYVRWSRRTGREEQMRFWKQYLEGFDTRTELPVRTRTVKREDSYGGFRLEFSPELTGKIAGFTRTRGVTLASLLYAVWGILLQQYNDSDDVVFGTTISGRRPEIAGMEQMVGLFLNTLPLRVRSEPGKTALEMLRDISNALEAREEYGDISVTELKQCFAFEIRETLFDSIMVIKNYPLDEKLKDGYEKLKVRSFSMNEVTNFDITLQVFTVGGLSIDFNYHCGLFGEAMIRRMAGHFLNTLAAILENPEKKVSSLDMLSDGERAEILHGFNPPAVDYPGDRLIHEIIEGQAAGNPAKTAVRHLEREISYESLNRKANQVAGMLKEQGVTAGAAVGLLVPRSIEMIVGLLGILKAGAVCVPLDTRHPEARTGFILEDSGAECLLVLEDAPFAGAFGGRVIKMAPEEMKRHQGTNHDNSIPSRSPAYLIYTSGSTGKPKGVALHHRGVINHIFTKVRVLEMNEPDVVGNNFSVNVVAAIWQILSPLMIGGTLLVYPEEVEKDPSLQFEMLSRDSVNIIEIIPSVLKAYTGLLKKGRKAVPLPALRRIALTSEETKPSVVKEYFQYYRIPLVNCYGQTECSDDTLHHTVSGYTEGLETVPIGRPSNNTRAYVMDRYFRLQPTGVKGELCISGDGLSGGYLNRPELTEEKFVENPLEPGQRMYRTGDLARWREDGIVEYLGRLDHQVKIRGNRIETGEIESRLLSYRDIREVAVVTREDGEENKYLCAYFVSDGRPTATELREYLRGELPDYMLPARFLQLSAMPLTPNGKIDRKALPDDAEEIGTGVAFAAPADEVEEKLLKIWKEILDKDRISTKDSFFDIGGNSIMMVQMLAEVSESYPGAVTMPDLFTYPTIAQLAAYVKSKAAPGARELSVEYVRLSEEYADRDGTGTEACSYRYGFPSSETEPFARVLRAEQATLFTALAGMLAFVLSRASGQKRVELQCLEPDTGAVAPVGYDFGDAGDAGLFIRTGAESCRKALDESSFRLRDYGALPRNREPGHILPLVYPKGRALPVQAPDVFNLIVSLEEKRDEVEISWEYRGRELKEEKTEELFREYIEFVYFFIKNSLSKETGAL